MPFPVPPASIAPALVDPTTGELIALPDILPPLSFDAARDLIPVLDDAAARIARLRGWAISVVEADCAANERTLVRIGDTDWTYRGGTAYRVDDPGALAAALADAGVPPPELDDAVWVIPPSAPSWGVHNGRLNQLAKQGGAVLAAIRRHRTETPVPARLEKKR